VGEGGNPGLLYLFSSLIQDVASYASINYPGSSSTLSFVNVADPDSQHFIQSRSATLYKDSLTEAAEMGGLYRISMIHAWRPSNSG
jgi:hypothetical protein